jgi:hypothetical protein
LEKAFPSLRLVMDGELPNPKKWTVKAEKA